MASLCDSSAAPAPAPPRSTSGLVALGVPAVGSERTHHQAPTEFPPHHFDPEQGLVDSFGRVARDLRVSLTDRCNLRCTYCMPAEGLPWLDSSTVLSDVEILRLLRLAVETLGIRSIRFTGGEPLLRASLEDIIAATAHLRTPDGHKPTLALTTNGLGLDKRAAALKDAGLDRVNISLDAASAEAFAAVTRRNRFNDVIRGIQGAQAAGLSPIKINAVILPGHNEDQILPLLRLCLEQGWQLRFIEHMPLGPRKQWNRADMITAADIQATLSDHATITPVGGRGSAPAELFDVTLRTPDSSNQKLNGQFGVIASVTQAFCAACDRTRLTADGAVRSCLFGDDELSLRDLMRAGAHDEELANAWSAITYAKKRGHGTNEVLESPLQPERPMSAIGG